MKLVAIFGALLILSSCANLVKGGAVSDAEKLVNQGRFSKALEKTEIAESFGELTPIEKAKLYFFRAQALEGLNRESEASGYYLYVAEQLETNPYTQSAKFRYKQLSGSAE